LKLIIFAKCIRENLNNALDEIVMFMSVKL